MSCFARQYSDQMMCSHCRLTWDMNDPEPPQCGMEKLGGRASEYPVKAIVLNSTPSGGCNRFKAMLERLRK